MAWGNKKKRELEYLKSGQAAALEVGDLGANEVYGADEDEFKAGWELEDDLEPDDTAYDNLELGDLEPARES